MYSAEIIGTGSYVPDHKVSNHDLSEFVDTSDAWISERTGIRERRITTEETTTDLAVKAAQRAIEDAGIKPDQIDLIVVGTTTGDYFFPSTACLVQSEIGAVNATCFDVSAACTGFIFGLSVAGQYIKTGLVKTALVIGAEVLSKIVDWQDRNTCVLFADGAGAVILQGGEEGIIAEITGSDGSGAKDLVCQALPIKNKFCDFSKDMNHYLMMNGREIYKFAVRIIPECIEKVLAKSDISISQVKHIIPHQANIRILDAAAKKLNIEKERFFVNIHNYGNTSGASIPLAFDEMAKAGLFARGDYIILVGFGAGLTYGAQLLRWTKKDK